MRKVTVRIFAVFFIVSALFTEGCAPLPLKREAKKMFAPYLPRIEDNPIIIVPGIIGSRLVDTGSGKIIWGSLRLRQVFFLSEREDIALPIDKLPLRDNVDSITSEGIIKKYEFPAQIIQFTVYKELLDMLENMGYKFGDIRNPKPGDNLYIFDYDWRRDNVENARILGQRIEDIKKATNRPGEKFNLICHSMGGLIGRYYVRYGGADVLDKAPNFKVTYEGAKHVKKLILIGVPNLGSIPVFHFLHTGLDLKIVKYQPYVLFTMPSIYQLLPPSGVKAFVDGEGNDIQVDIYDVENWKKFGFSIFSEKMRTYTTERYKSKFKNTWQDELGKFEEARDRFVQAALDRARSFHESLDFATTMEPSCEIVLFGGDTEWTLDKAILKQDRDSNWRVSFWDPRLEDKILKPGDSMVTRESLLGVYNAGVTRKSWAESPMHISFSLFVTRRHENIHKDATFQNNLMHILLGD